jgi:hypothetical protein
MRRIALLLALAGAATIPAAATAQTPTPRPKQGRLVLRVERAGDGTVLVGQRLRLRGALKPYVAKQRVVVRFYAGGKRVKQRTLAVQRVSDQFGRFLLGFTPRTAGTVTARVSHLATKEMGTVVGTSRPVRVIRPGAGFGARGPAVRWLQSRLRAEGYDPSSSGGYDAKTARAVLAFRKLTGRARTTQANVDVFRALAHGGGQFRVRYPEHGKHVEADLTHQVLALIAPGGRVVRIEPLSSGKPSTPTVLGHFHVYRRSPGTNAHGMFMSNYFIGGYAIHGYPDVPVYAASHGCLRISNASAVAVYRWISFGDPVDVYYRTPGHKSPPVRGNAGP